MIIAGPYFAGYDWQKERLTVVTPPDVEPITLAEAKLHCRVTWTDEDTLFTDLIAAARQQVESDMRRAIVTRTFNAVFDDFPPLGRPVLLPCPPLQSITFIKYIDGSGTLQTLDSSLYIVELSDEENGRVGLAAGQIWPAVIWQIGAVTVQFKAGYGEYVAVPSRVKVAMKLMVQLLYERGDGGAPGVLDNVEKAYDRVIGGARNTRYV